MKHSVAIGLSLALSACGNSATWLGSEPGRTQVSGSPANTTKAFDGTYRGVAIQNNSKGGNTLAPGGGTGTVKCQNYAEPPTLTVTNGLAQFDALGVRFAGYVTPQGHLKMHTGYGATVAGQIKPVSIDEDFDGDFDAQTHILHGQVLGACAYNVSWQKTE
jgi:hypothetical protein